MTKQLFILFILTICLSYPAIADSATLSVTENQNRNTEIETLKSKVELLEKHESWVVTILGIGLAGATIILGLLQFYFTKKAEDNVFANLSKIANEDKEAFKEAVRMKSIEIELMSYPIYIVYDTAKQKTIPQDLYKLLCAYRFGNIKKPISYEGAFSEKFDEKTILIFCADSYNADECERLMKKNPSIGVLGFGLYKAFSFPSDHLCLNFANSFSSVYNNLMSLLHYKRYLLSLA